MFAVDIDGTIAGGREGYSRYLQYLNQRIQVPAEEAALNKIARLRDLEQLPEVQAYLHDPGRQRKYTEALQAAEHDPELQRTCTPLPYAVESLTKLAQDEDIIYVTCRRKESRATTQAWLKQHGFPYAERVYCCERYHHKYIHACEAAGPSEPIILVDDLLEMMITAFRYMIRIDFEAAKRIYKRLTVVGYSYKEVPTFPVKITFPVLPLPSWMPEDLAALRRQAPQQSA